jgi:hypothetical protein
MLKITCTIRGAASRVAAATRGVLGPLEDLPSGASAGKRKAQTVTFGYLLLVVALIAIIASIWLTSDHKRLSQPSQVPKQIQDDGLSNNFSALVNAIHYEGAANRSEEGKEDRGRKIIDVITLIVLTLTLIALSETYVAISDQVEEMKKVYQPISDSASAAANSAKAALQANELNRAQLRAHISIPENPESGIRITANSLDVKLEISNTGESTARSTQINLNIAIEGRGNSLVSTGTQVLIFNDIPKGAVEEKTVQFVNAQPEKTKAILGSGVGIIHVNCDIHYADIFDEAIHTKFTLFRPFLEPIDFKDFVSLERLPFPPPIDQVTELPKQQN